jgi:hypothetical protein
VQGGADRKGHPRKTSSLPLRRSIHGSEAKNRRVVNGGACLPVGGADTHRFRCRCLGTSGRVGRGGVCRCEFSLIHRFVRRSNSVYVCGEVVLVDE